jgi:hypothetical protein
MCSEIISRNIIKEENLFIGKTEYISTGTQTQIPFKAKANKISSNARKASIINFISNESGNNNYFSGYKHSPACVNIESAPVTFYKLLY